VAAVIVATGRKRLTSTLQRLFILLKAHNISYWAFKRQDVEIEGANYRAVSSVIYSLTTGASYRLIKRCFSTRQSFDDKNTFYDVSMENWRLPNLQYAPVKGKVAWIPNRLFKPKVLESELLPRGLCLCLFLGAFSAVTLPQPFITKAEV